MSRESLLHAATLCFGERGYHATHVRSIAERAATTKASLYHHFSDKEALWREAVDRAAQALDTALQHHLVVLRLEPWVQTYLETVVDWAQSCPEQARLLARASVEPPEVPRWQAHRFSVVWGTLRQLIRQSDAPEGLELVLSGTSKELMLRVLDGTISDRAHLDELTALLTR